MIVHGDCVAEMAKMPEASVDAICTDPPYGLEFMGKEWDRLAGTPGYNERGRITNRSGETHNPARGAGKTPINSFQAGRPMQEWHEAWAREALRVLKPGGHLLAFGGTRTYHRLACAIEDAGFEIRDCLSWMYGSGFPKSLDVSKAIDRAADYKLQAAFRRSYVRAVEAVGLTLPGNSRHDWTSAEHAPGDKWWAEFCEWLPTLTDEQRDRIDREVLGPAKHNRNTRPTVFTGGGEILETAPATPEARQWQGWGTALKPAHEPIVMARKPLAGTVAANCLEYGTGALNIDGCRIGTDTERGERYNGKAPGGGDGEILRGPKQEKGWTVPAGRWPANVVLSHFSGADWYSPANELDTETVAAFYGVGEALRALRETDPGDAVATGEAQVLLSGVRWRFTERQAQEGMGQDRVPSVRQDVRGHAGMGEGGSSPVLLSEVSGRGNGGRDSSGGPSHGRESREDERGEQGQDGAALEPVEGWPALHDGGLRDGDDRHAAGGHAGARSSDVPDEALRAGASGGGGREARSAPAAIGGRASLRRAKGEQRSGESVRGGEGGAQRGASADREAATRGDGADRGVGGRDGRLEVREDLIPSGWASSFVYVDTSGGCEQVGTRRVKGSNPSAARGEQPRSYEHETVYEGGIGKDRAPNHHVDADGLETVEAWRCVESCPVRLLDEQSGELRDGVAVRHRSGGNTFGGENAKPPMDDMGYGGSGGASRFFATFEAFPDDREALGTAPTPDGSPSESQRLEDSVPAPEQGEHSEDCSPHGQDSETILWNCAPECRFRYVAKASSAERNAGLEGFEERHAPKGNYEGRDLGNERNHLGGLQGSAQRNVHPTVKPIALMRWLVRLVTPPGGTVLDPFAGSGTTGIAAALEGFNFVGIEREEEYVRIAEARIKWWSEHPEGMDMDKALKADRERRAVADTGQLGFLD